MMQPAVAAGAAFAAAGIAAWFNSRVRGFLPDDPPRPGRKQHQRSLPLAGIVLVPAMAPWLIAAERWWLLCAMGIAAVTGFVDDWKKERGDGLGWRTKAIGLAMASGALAIGDFGDRGWSVVAVLLLVVVVTNATNVLDNTDGVAAALSATSLLVVSGGVGEYAAIGFAALGFLPWNWPRPRLFLGDSGAFALGVAAGVAVADRAVTAADPAWLWAIAVQLADFVQVVFARLVLGLPPWVGDRRHLTHIVRNLGVPGVLIAPMFAAVALALGYLNVGQRL